VTIVSLVDLSLLPEGDRIRWEAREGSPSLKPRNASPMEAARRRASKASAARARNPEIGSGEGTVGHASVPLTQSSRTPKTEQAGRLVEGPEHEPPLPPGW
jgi:hypothetical protein